MKLETLNKRWFAKLFKHVLIISVINMIIDSFPNILWIDVKIEVLRYQVDN